LWRRGKIGDRPKLNLPSIACTTASTWETGSTTLAARASVAFGRRIGQPALGILSCRTFNSGTTMSAVLTAAARATTRRN